jgi:hypothetical protein
MKGLFSLAVLAGAAWPAPAQGVTFYKDLTPIIFGSCAP